MRHPAIPSPTVQLEHALFRERQVEVFVKRDDLIHQDIMGNKWRKLKYNLQEANARKARRLLTFGGAYSNHIAAVAAAAAYYGFEATGIIRGEELNPSSNPTLRYARELGMTLQFVSRKDYRALKDAQHTRAEDNTYVIPEGGTNAYALRGVEELLTEIDTEFDVVVVPVGTGGTLAGLVSGLKGSKRAIGVSSLKGEFIKKDVDELLKKIDVPFHNYEILTEYHFGGYGRYNQELIRFIHIFRRDFGFMLEPIYTGKMFFGVFERIAEGAFEKGTRIMVIHTGGLQGIQGFNARFGNLIQDT